MTCYLSLPSIGIKRDEFPGINSLRRHLVFEVTVPSLADGVCGEYHPAPAVEYLEGYLLDATHHSIESFVPVVFVWSEGVRHKNADVGRYGYFLYDRIAASLAGSHFKGHRVGSLVFKQAACRFAFGVAGAV